MLQILLSKLLLFKVFVVVQNLLLNKNKSRKVSLFPLPRFRGLHTHFSLQFTFQQSTQRYNLHNGTIYSLLCTQFYTDEVQFTSLRIYKSAYLHLRIYKSTYLQVYTFTSLRIYKSIYSLRERLWLIVLWGLCLSLGLTIFWKSVLYLSVLQNLKDVFTFQRRL